MKEWKRKYWEDSVAIKKKMKVLKVKRTGRPNSWTHLCDCRYWRNKEVAIACLRFSPS